MGLIESFSGSATEYAAGNGDVSEVATGSTYGIFRFENTSDVPIVLHVRETGSSDDSKHDISPHTYSPDITLGLTSAKTIDYYLEGGGSIQCYIVYYFGTTGISLTVTIADIRTTLLDAGYSTADISDATIQGYIDIITGEITDAATRHANIAGFTLNSSIKINAIKMGSLWMTLMLIHNKGMGRGLESQTARVSLQTAKDYQDMYNNILSGIKSGIQYGA